MALSIIYRQLQLMIVVWTGKSINGSYVQTRRGHTKIYQKDIVDVLDKHLLEGMDMLLTEEVQQKCEERVRIYFPLDVSTSSIFVRVI